MSNTYTSLPSFREIVHRLALPFALFTGVLMALLLLSWFLLLPGFTRVDIAGTVRSIGEVRGYQQELAGDIRSSADIRDTLVSPLKGTSYEFLREEKRGAYSFEELRTAIDQVVTAIATDYPQSIVIHHVVLDTAADEMLLSGDVRNVGPRSMTLLAQFADSLRGVSSVKDVKTPRFIREEDAVIGMHSPFTFTLSLQ